ncbi:MAG: methyl-accepting chemotaxis protein [Acidovorax temperans]|uniref:methyl-accepting chemotaxis protein n=1 Tax=Acidovorax temperans TaxID=80878 RepID=UPI00391BA287
MKLLSGLRLGYRLALGFGLVLLLLLGISAMSLQRLGGLTDTLDQIAVRGAERGQAVMDMERAANTFMMVLRDMPGSDLGDAEAMLKKASQTWSNSQQAEQRTAALLPDDASVKALLEAAVNASVGVHEVIDIGIKAAGDRGDSASFFNMRQYMSSNAAEWRGRQAAWSEALVKLSEWDATQRRAASMAGMDSAVGARIFVIAGVLLALVIGTATAVLITRDVSRGIGEAVRVTQRMAQHDLSVPVDVRRQDELGALAQALEAMRIALHRLAVGVRDASGDVANASTEIAQGSLDLSGRTEQAAITLQSAIGSISELSSSVDQTAQSASSANQLAAEAKTVATRGGEVVAQAVATMDEIEAASRKIADITAIIDAIAFQTNILALNAAVEAARAGEQGRGFAVVAGEVRTLAQRSATAAREIKALIESSLERVAFGSAQVRRAGGSTDEIMNSVQRVSGIIAAITDEAGQQRQGIVRVHESVQALDLVAQQNAALAEQSAAAAGSLQQQAQRLTQMVARFRLETAADAERPEPVQGVCRP